MTSSGVGTLFLVLAFSLAASKSNSTTFRAYRLFRIIPTAKEDVPILSETFQILQMDVWHEARNSSAYFDVMANPDQARNLHTHTHTQRVLYLLDIEGTVIVSDLHQKLHIQSGRQNTNTASAILLPSRPVAPARGGYPKFSARQSSPPLNWQQVTYQLTCKASCCLCVMHSRRIESIRQPPKGFDWSDYHSLDDMYSWMRSKAAQYASIASLLVIGESIEGRPLLGLRIAHKRDLPIAVIEAGVHAREWIGPPTALWFANEVIDSRLQIARSFEWHIFPTLNPDGYVYSYNTNRWWRKNRNHQNPSCVGVDINRNFPFQWEREDHCGEMSPGSDPSSEPETKAFEKHLSSIARRAKVYISLHSYGQYLMYPWAYTNHAAFSERRLDDIARQAAATLAKRYGTSYSVGRVATTIYRVGGSSLDYAFSLNIPYTFVFELRGGEMSASSPGGFLLSRSQIIPTAQETYDAVLVILQRASTF